MDVHVVTHTHWDREWYHPAERFRQRLVALIDELIDDPPQAGESFLLDGQAIVLDDYLHVRPDRFDVLARMLRDGQLEAGPWYVLADELIPSGEALVRNLFAGRRALRRFGAEPPQVLYCPDSFGHPAALPSIAAGFGLPLVILWRGYGGKRWPAGDTVRWSSPAGDSVLLFHLPRDGYEFGSHLPPDDDGAVARWTRMRAELAPRSATGVVLVPNGADHHARQLNLRDALAAIERAGASDGVHRSSLRAFAAAVVARGSAQSLRAVRGELRDSYGYAWTLQGTFGTRAHEKRLNAHAERALVREAEPWSALAARAGRSRRPLVEAAWQTLLTAHPHDTLCGCSIDAVADAMELRLRSAITQAHGIRDDSILDQIGHDAASARVHRDAWQPIVIVRNASARPRSGVAIVELEEFLADVPVGPGSATEPADAPASPSAIGIPSLGAVQRLARETVHSLTESPRHYPDNDLVLITRAAVWIDNVPAYGLSPHAIGGGVGQRTRPPAPVRVDARTMSNGLLTLEIEDEGAVALAHDATGRRIASLFEFVDETDLGDLYTPSPRPRAIDVEYRGARRVHRGPLRGEIALGFRIIDAESARRRTDAELTVRLVLDAGAAFLRVEVAGENRRENHRLRMGFASDVESAAVWADAAFGPVQRKPIVASDDEAAVERPPATAPLHRYVSLFDRRAGFTLFSDGLAEYEARDGSMLVTLVRSVGQLSRSDIPERPGNAGWPRPTPGAQCLGPFAASFAVMPHGPRVPQTVDAIERASDDVLCPLVGNTLRSALRVPEPVVGVELSGTGLAFSAIKESDDGEWFVLRCVNLLDARVSGRWSVPFGIRDARLARLDETPISDLSYRGSSVEFTAEARAIVTMLVR